MNIRQAILNANKVLAKNQIKSAVLDCDFNVISFTKRQKICYPEFR